MWLVVRQHHSLVQGYLIVLSIPVSIYGALRVAKIALATLLTLFHTQKTKSECTWVLYAERE